MKPIVATITVDRPRQALFEPGAKGKRVSYGTYRLREATPSSTEVEFELRIETMPRREKLLAPVLRPWLQRVNDKAMARLKDHASRGDGPAARAVYSSLTGGSTREDFAWT
jgi:hypothetical protein